jgi:acyl-CoA hydrolase
VLSVASCSRQQEYTPITAGATVIAFGDSITFGTGARPGEDFPTHLAVRSGWNVINAGIPGDMARDAGARLAPLLDQYQPVAVLVELGGNDFLRQRSESAVKEDLRAILNTIRDYGALPILVAVPRFSMLRATVGALSDSTIYAELADEEGVPLISGALSAVLSDESLRADPIHPNAAGYARLADEMADSLTASGLLL